MIAFFLAGRLSVHVTTPSARSMSRDVHADYRSGVGFNPFRQQVKRRSDIVLVAVAVLVVALLVLWAAMPGDGSRPRLDRLRRRRDAVDVRHVQPYQADKTYRCPGCDHEIRPGEGTRSWSRATRPTTGGTGTPAAGTARNADYAHQARDRPEALDALDARSRRQNAASMISTSQPPRPSGRTDATSKRSDPAPRAVFARATARPASGAAAACARVTASAGARSASPRRVFTSQNTIVRPRADDESISPSRTRQLRSSTS